jgi:hypothetical protein
LCHLGRRERSPKHYYLIRKFTTGFLPFALRASLRLFKSLLVI